MPSISACPPAGWLSVPSQVRLKSPLACDHGDSFSSRQKGPSTTARYLMADPICGFRSAGSGGSIWIVCHRLGGTVSTTSSPSNVCPSAHVTRDAVVPHRDRLHRHHLDPVRSHGLGQLLRQRLVAALAPVHLGLGPVRLDAAALDLGQVAEVALPLERRGVVAGQVGPDDRLRVRRHVGRRQPVGRVCGRPGPPRSASATAGRRRPPWRRRPAGGTRRPSRPGPPRPPPATALRPLTTTGTSGFSPSVTFRNSSPNRLAYATHVGWLLPTSSAPPSTFLPGIMSAKLRTRPPTRLRASSTTTS